MPIIKTPKGTYKFKLIPIYPGWKLIDKEKAFENLSLFKEIADRNEFKFFLAYGTMLGAVREKDFIDHDEDIDLGADYQDVDKFLSMLSSCGRMPLRWHAGMIGGLYQSSGITNTSTFISSKNIAIS